MSGRITAVIACTVAMMACGDSPASKPEKPEELKPGSSFGDCRTADCGDDEEDASTNSDIFGSQGGCPSVADLNQQTVRAACSDLSLAETCGNGEVESGELCFEGGTLAAASPPGLPIRQGTRPQMRAVSASDLDGDGNVDLVGVVRAEVEDSGSRHALVVYWNRGTEGFESPVTLGTWANRAGHPTVVDLDDDGVLDVALVGAAQSSSADLIVFWGESRRAFERHDAPLSNYPVDPRGQIFVADLNSDNRYDVLMNGGIAAITGNDRSFDFETMRASDKIIETIVDVVDVDGNGQRDLVGLLREPSNDESQLYLVSDIANGALSTPSEVAAGTQYWTAAASWDSDPERELIGLRHGPGAAPGSVALEMRIWDIDDEGHYDSPFSAVQLTPLRHDQGSPPTAMKIADLDGDSHADLVFLDSTEVPEQCDVPDAWRAAHIVLGDGSMGGTEPPCQPAFIGRPIDIEVADLNGDHVPDVAAATTNGLEVLFSRP